MVFDFGSLRVFMKGFKKRVLGRLGGWSVDREDGLSYYFSLRIYVSKWRVQ
jgi:hypothetical protein